MSKQLPTVGRKVWFWCSQEVLQVNGTDYFQPVVLSHRQAMDATVVHVSVHGRINLLVNDHVGGSFAVEDVELLDFDEAAPPVQGHICEHSFATWTPYSIANAMSLNSEVPKQSLTVGVGGTSGSVILTDGKDV